ncbi:hypothetical protein [Fluviicola chungangensis]|uniref:Uncharacterized protein n=1 Tax=Fluviicola chungangensis TaxID=2597671 RepID=A0A556MN74_9FLAO|nr:hypothetical protein [Fluviicola chungangensis]TSJ41282.1 hypothetical protein FO442_15335 [Fluviicola chungangensis]
MADAEDRYTVQDMIRIMDEVKKNPEGHKYPSELIERFRKYEEKLNAIPISPAFAMAGGINRAIEQMYRRNPFVEISQNSPHAKWARQIDYIDSMFRTNSIFEKVFAESAWAKHARQIDEIAKNIPIAMGAFYESLSLLSEQGWYVSPRPFDDISINKIPYYLKAENAIEFEEMIVDEIEKALPELISDCQESFPNRADIFDEIHRLYKNSFFRSVVTMCYTQADGISNDIFQVGFFDKDRNEEYKLKSYLRLRQLNFNYSPGIIKQLDIPTNEITANSQSGHLQETEKKARSFNRHLVLHGHSLEYGTKLNAIRAICVLDFLQYLTKAVDITEISPNITS